MSSSLISALIEGTQNLSSLGYNVIITRCSRHYGFNVRPRATNTVLGLRLLRSLQSSDSVGGTRADIKPIMPRAAGLLYTIRLQMPSSLEVS